MLRQQSSGGTPGDASLLFFTLLVNGFILWWFNFLLNCQKEEPECVVFKNRRRGFRLLFVIIRSIMLWMWMLL